MKLMEMEKNSHWQFITFSASKQCSNMLAPSHLVVLEQISHHWQHNKTLSRYFYLLFIAAHNIIKKKLRKTKKELLNESSFCLVLLFVVCATLLYNFETQKEAKPQEYWNDDKVEHTHTHS